MKNKLPLLRSPSSVLLLAARGQCEPDVVAWTAAAVWGGGGGEVGVGGSAATPPPGRLQSGCMAQSLSCSYPQQTKALLLPTFFFSYFLFPLLPPPGTPEPVYRICISPLQKWPLCVSPPLSRSEGRPLAPTHTCRLSRVMTRNRPKPGVPGRMDRPQSSSGSPRRRREE